MASSFACVWLHLVFSTKYREPTLSNPAFRKRLHAYQASILQRIECEPTIVNGVEDHVHLLFALARTKTIAEVVEEVKRVSSKWARKHQDGQENFSWQRGYAVFGVSRDDLDATRSYIENQERHHAHRTFKDELLEQLSQHGIAPADESVWD